MKIKYIVLTIVFNIVFGSQLSGCGGQDTHGLSASINAVPTLKEIIPLDISDDNSIHIDSSSFEGYSKMVLVLYGIDADNIYGKYYVHMQNSGEPAHFLNSQIVSDDGIDNSALFLDDYLNAEIEDNSEPINDCTESFNNDQIDQPGDTRTFTVNYMHYQIPQISAVLAYQYNNINIYIDQQDTNLVDGDMLGDDIASLNSYIDHIREIFGSESDIDCNHRVNILLTHVVNNLSYASSSILGFFQASDLNDDNHMEILYIGLSNSTGQSVIETMAHELGHLIAYNQRMLLGNGVNEISSFNEGIAMLASDIFSYEDGIIKQASSNSRGMALNYLTNSSIACFMCPQIFSRPEIRGAAYLFIRYLYEQANLHYFDNVQDGNELIKRLLDGSYSGKSNILHALGETDSNTFDDILGDFAVTLFLSQGYNNVDQHHQLQGIKFGQNAINRSFFLMMPYASDLTVSGLGFYEFDQNNVFKDNKAIDIYVDSQLKFGAYLLLME